MGSPKLCGIIKEVEFLICVTYGVEYLAKDVEQQVSDADSRYNEVLFHWFKRMFLSTSKSLILRDEEFFSGLVNLIELLIYNTYKEPVEIS
jgi:hypothetical protein